MKLLVCVKQVAESQTRFEIDPINARARLINPLWQMNGFDEFALEEAVRLKESYGGVRLEMVTVGPSPARQVLDRAVGMGVDQAWHIIDTRGDDVYRSPLTTASWLAAFAREREYDLILCGVMSEDDMQAQTGPMLAEFMGIPWATSVVQIAIEPESKTVTVEREIEGGYRDRLELKLPALLTIQTGVNKPRYPSLSNLLRAKETPPQSINSEELPGPTTIEHRVRVDLPQRTRAGITLEGITGEKAARLVRILGEKGLI